MKVLQFGKFYPPDLGGIETVMYELTEGLNEAGIQCDVLCSNTHKKTLFENKNNYFIIRTASFGKKFSTSISPSLIWYLYKIHTKYDILHVHLPDPLAILAVLLVRPKCKIILHWHGDVDFNKFKFLQYIYKPLQHMIIKRADHIIAPTKVHIEKSNVYKSMKEKYTIIPFPFNTKELLKCDINHQLVNSYKSCNKFIIFALGRLSYYKGFNYLIEAAKYLTDDILIIIGGTGEEENNLKTLIINRKLENKVRLVGKIDHTLLATYYSMCDLFCFPSIYQGEMFGMVQLEAMIFKKPIVGTKISNSGVCEVNIDNLTGLCVEIKNDKALSEAILKLKNDRELYNQFSKNAFDRVLNVFDKSVVIPKYIEFYEKILKNRDKIV